MSHPTGEGGGGGGGAVETSAAPSAIAAAAAVSLPASSGDEADGANEPDAHVPLRTEGKFAAREGSALLLLLCFMR